ncbi:MAG: LytTR family DNA-binding domain-containing protein [bacterium]
MTEKLYKRVEKYCLPERKLVTQDGEVVRVKDIVFLTIEGKIPVAVAENNKKYNIVQNLSFFEKEFRGYFLRVHRSFLVAFDRIKVVYERYPEEVEPEIISRDRGGAADECELALRGSEARIPVTNTYSGALKKALGVSSLHHLLPEHPEDKRLRKMGIIDFAWRELYELDPKDTEAVEAFVGVWRVLGFGKERTLRYFRRFGENQIDKRRLAKNIIWQTWRWIMKGIREPFDGNMGFREQWNRKLS